MSQACALFLCCDRPARPTTATPVVMCVSLTADSVLLTCWPPAPPERMVSTRTSDSAISILMLLSTTGKIATDENEVCRRAVESDGESPPQPVYAGFGLEPAIGVVAADLDGGGFDAGLFALGFFQIFNLEAVLLRPARVHPQQHRGPVLALGAACAGMHFEIGIEPVGLARQQRLQFAATVFLLEHLQRVLGLGDHALVVLGFAEFDHFDIVAELALDLADALKRIHQRGALLHQLLGLLGIVPEIGIFGELVQLGETCRGLFDVKDASSAARPTA